MSASNHVGRVGGLAIALGVGAAIVVGAAPAWADTGADTGTDAGADAGPGPAARADAGPARPNVTRGHPAAGGRPAPGLRERPATAGPAASAQQAPQAPQASRSAPVLGGLIRSLAAAIGSADPALPAAPVESPIGWAVVAAARQSARATAAATAPANSIASLFFNQTPTLSPTRTGQDSASVVTGDLTINDPDSAVETYTVTREPVNGTVAVDSDGRYVYTPSAQFSRTGTTDTFTVTVSDADNGFHIHGLVGLINLLTFGLIGDPGHATTATVNVVVDPRNTAPVGAVSLGATDPITGRVTGRVIGSDADGDPLTYTGSATTSKGSVSVAADGGFSYTPTATARHDAAALVATEVDKTDVFTVTIKDEYGGKTNVSVRVDVSPLNEAPVAGLTVGAPDPSNGVVTGRVSATDPEGDPLTYSGSTTTSKGSVAVAGDGSFTYTPTAAARHGSARLSASVAEKTDTFTVTVTDDSGGVTSVPVTVTLSPTNIAPIVGGASVGAPDATSGLVTGSISASDGDGDQLSYSAAPATGSVSFAANGTFSYTPSTAARQAAANGGAVTDTFTVTLVDGYGGSAAVAVTVGIAPALAPPQVSFAFVYGNGAGMWSTDARSALESTAASLASYFVVASPVTITISVSGMNSPSSSTLAYASTDFTSYSAGFYGTVIQAEVQTGVDPNGGGYDGYVTYNWAYPWALGNSVAGNQYDFKAVALHELLHTAGFLTGTGNPSNPDTNWTTYDSFLSTSNNTRVIDPNTYTIGGAYVGNFTGSGGGLYFGGPNAVAAYGGPVPLYTPGSWAGGSSVSHVNQLGGYVMNPFSGTGLGPRVLTATEVAILRDLGYTMNNSPGVAAFIVVWVGWARRRRNR